MSDIADDTPITLAQACDTFFNGVVKPASLMAEWRRGNLPLSKIGRTYFTTIADLKEMRERCRVHPKVQDSGSTRTEATGVSETERRKSAQDAAKKIASALKRR